jgi:hypothetical protein
MPRAFAPSRCIFSKALFFTIKHARFCVPLFVLLYIFRHFSRLIMFIARLVLFFILASHKAQRIQLFSGAKRAERAMREPGSMQGESAYQCFASRLDARAKVLRDECADNNAVACAMGARRARRPCVWRSHINISVRVRKKLSRY